MSFIFDSPIDSELLNFKRAFLLFSIELMKDPPQQYNAGILFLTYNNIFPILLSTRREFSSIDNSHLLIVKLDALFKLRSLREFIKGDLK